MITEFRLFETLNPSTPTVGDYVIMKKEFVDILDNFTRNNIGQFIDVEQNAPNDFRYIVEFDTEIPKEISGWFYAHGGKKENRRKYRVTDFSDSQPFEYWSEDKKELEAVLKGKQFDL